MDFVDIRSATKANKTTNNIGDRELRTNYNEPGNHLAVLGEGRGTGDVHICMTEAKLDDKRWVVSILMHTMRYFEPIAAGIYQVSLTFLYVAKCNLG